MIEIIKELDIEVSKPNVFQAVVAKQYDMNTRFIRATFVDGKEKITIDPAATVKVVINALRPDGESKGFEGEVNEDGTVTVPLHSWMLELDGTVVCDISVIDIESDDNKKLTTTSFTLLVEKAAFGGDDITTDPQFDVLVSLMDAAAVAQEALDKSNEALKLVADCEEATENANAVREEIEAGGYIESLKELNEGEKFSFWVGTQAEYDELEQKQGNTLYLITDDTTEEDINNQLNQLEADATVELNTIREDIDDLKATEGKMTLIYDYKQNGDKTLYDNDEAEPLTTQVFPLYYITIWGGSSAIIAGGVDWQKTDWAIRGSGNWIDANSTTEIFVNMQYNYQTEKLKVNRVCSITHDILSGKFSMGEGQSIAKIYGIGKF